ncbi:Zn(II)2Cys6 transcription factor [Aspergillus lucknowensis]|uniref:Fungal-specific transcription factor domain-containing protein n=1 Tax=Aspergillus lucknowensis TaxID=176173 RepID=A0ABR4LHT6_9EURO
MARHRKIVCSACRRRKTKCDSATPSCSTCVALSSRCEYEKAPSIAYVRALQERIRQLEGAPPSRVQRGLETAHCTPAPASFNNEDADSFSVNARGDVSYHNPTSAIHEAPVEEPSKPAPQSRSPDTPTDSQRNELRQSLVANAATQKTLEILNLQTIPHGGIPATLGSVLLQLHWCWLHPMFLFVYRPAFTRDMTRLGNDDQSSYCSLTLLKVLYAHSCRFIRAPEGIWDEVMHGESFGQFTDRLMSEAKISLAMETLQAPSIPTIQALLQQSARDVACGRSSQAWLFSGMAFRMAIDLGLHVSTDKLLHYAKSLSAEDIEIRKRLFWSLYSWDKHISLYLGRMPNFVLGAENVPLVFLDDFSEDDPWEPFYGPDPKAEQLPAYPATPGHVISCFTALCKLCTIVSQLMLELYSAQPSRAKPKMAAFARIGEDLNDWWTALPPFLRILPDNIPTLSPPPHITSLNLMYHTTRILLHRPHVAGRQSSHSPAVQQSWRTCRTATTAIYDLLKMYVATFGFHHITYMNSYCTYTAATTAVYQLESDILETGSQLSLDSSTAWMELKFLLDILQRTAVAMPGLERSIGIIRTRIKKILDRQAARQLQSLFTSDPTTESTTSTKTMGDVPSLSEINHNSYSPSRERQNSLPSNLISQPNLGTSEWDSWLPAFPGQEVFYGAESMLDVQAGLSPDARSALMGSNLDPHVRLDFSISEDLSGAGALEYTGLEGSLEVEL